MLYVITKVSFKHYAVIKGMTLSLLPWLKFSICVMWKVIVRSWSDRRLQITEAANLN